MTARSNQSRRRRWIRRSAGVGIARGVEVPVDRRVAEELRIIRDARS